MSCAGGQTHVTLLAEMQRLWALARCAAFLRKARHSHAFMLKRSKPEMAAAQCADPGRQPFISELDMEHTPMISGCPVIIST